MRVQFLSAVWDFFLELTFSAGSLQLRVLKSLHSHHMQLHAPTCARMLKIPQTGIVWTHKNTDILTGMGSAALVAAVALLG